MYIQIQLSLLITKPTIIHGTFELHVVQRCMGVA